MLLEKFSKNNIHRSFFFITFSIYYNLNFAFSVPIVLVGNKKDLHMERSISTEQGKQLADSWKVSFMEASAKQNDVKFHRVINHCFLVLFKILKL